MSQTDPPTEFDAALARIATFATVLVAARDQVTQFTQISTNDIFEKFKLSREPLRWAPQSLHNPITGDVHFSVSSHPIGDSQLELLASGNLLDTFVVTDTTEFMLAFVLSHGEGEGVRMFILFMQQ